MRTVASAAVETDTDIPSSYLYDEFGSKHVNFTVDPGAKREKRRIGKYQYRSKHSSSSSTRDENTQQRLARIS